MIHQKYMNMAIKMAKKSKGFHLPNPMVGAIIVKNDEVIARGYHAVFGQEHAEAMAINEAINKNIDLQRAWIYVTLEPCSKHGKTMPCVELIIKHKFSKVIIGSVDRSDHHSIELLKKHNIEVISGVLNEKTDNLIRNFNWNIKSQQPYVIAKIATSIDGYMATRHNDSKWITSEKTRKFARRKRAFVQGILIGGNTAIIDNPFLTTRIKDYKDPYIIIVSPLDSLKKSLNVFANPEKVIVFNDKHDSSLPVKQLRFHKGQSTKVILDHLWSLNIKSILIEGGPFTVGKFFEEQNVNELNLYLSNKLFGDREGKNAFNFRRITSVSEANQFKLLKVKKIENDTFLRYEVK